jgi:fermentation-respiration switch protein FrsA (DUF1100 family)
MTGCVSRMFYHPDRVAYGTPAASGHRFEEVYFASRDGTALRGWFIPARGASTGTVVHLHGNAANMSAHFPFVAWLPARGFNVFTFDYRGYGASAGRPERRGIYEDSLAAIEHVLARADVDPARVVVLGQSLGGANALAVLGREGTRGVKAVVADSAFFSYRSIVADKIGAMPGLSLLRGPLSRAVIGDELSPGDVVGRISPVPLLFLHGTADRVIPASHSQRLHEAASEPKTLWFIPGLDHTEAITDRPWQDRIVAFFLAALDAPR